MKKKSNKTNKNNNVGIAGAELKRYNATKAAATTSTLEPFQSEDQALEYFAEILVAAYSEQKTV